MRIGRILFPVRELGPGSRLGIWVQGCLRACPGCANPELQAMDEKQDIPEDILFPMLCTAAAAGRLDGITVTGGEPMLQAGAVRRMLEALRPLCGDVLVYTGFTIGELRASGDPDVAGVLARTSVLVDGEYRAAENRGERLRGSANQRIIFLDEAVRPRYEAYMRAGSRIIDSFVAVNGIVSVGIHPPEFRKRLDRDPGIPPRTDPPRRETPANAVPEGGGPG